MLSLCGGIEVVLYSGEWVAQATILDQWFVYVGAQVGSTTNIRLSNTLVNGSFQFVGKTRQRDNGYLIYPLLSVCSFLLTGPLTLFMENVVRARA